MAGSLINHIWQNFLELNLYKKASSDAQTIPKERLATRIYVCTLFGFFLAITIVAAFVVRTIEKIEYSPSHIKFSELVHNFPNTLHCPCSEFGIPYDTFVTTRADFHQVCSSEFVQQTWIDLIFTNESISFWSIDDFRVTLSFFWQVIASFCVMSNKTWNDVMTSFGASHILSPTAVVEEVVRSQAEIALNKQVALAQATLARNLLAIQRMISGNEIMSGLATNFYVGYSSLNLDTWDSPRAWPRMFNDCSCLNIEGCPRPATLYNSSGHLVTVPGMIIDCLIVDATLASTLECYYDQACLSLLHQSLTIAAKPLSNSSNRHFSMHSTVQMLLNELMIDEITSVIRFDLFYSQCHPAYCSYSYTSRFNVIFIVTTIAGIFGGLSFVLRLIAPFIASVILRRKNRVLSHNSALDTMPSQQNRRKLNSVLRSVLENSLREKEFIKD